jgi:hypothetical protein
MPTDPIGPHQENMAEVIAVGSCICNQWVTPDNRGYALAWLKGGSAMVGVRTKLKTVYRKLCCEGDPHATAPAFQVAYANLSLTLSGFWSQSGWGQERKEGTNIIIKYRYAECQGNKYQVFYDVLHSPSQGSEHTYQCQLTAATGTWGYSSNSVQWVSFTDTGWIAKSADVGQFSGEVFNIEDQMPGSSAMRCSFQDCEYQSADGSYQSVDITGQDIFVSDEAKFGAQILASDCLEIWDKRT